MFSTFRNQPGVYRQLSLAPKYYCGDNKIVIVSEGKITQEEIFVAAVYRVEKEVKYIVNYNPFLDAEKVIPPDEVCSVVENYYEVPENNITIYHIENFFVVTKLLRADVIAVEVAGENYSRLKDFYVDNDIDVSEKMHNGIHSVQDLLSFVEKYTTAVSLPKNSFEDSAEDPHKDPSGESSGESPGEPTGESQ